MINITCWAWRIRSPKKVGQDTLPRIQLLSFDFGGGLTNFMLNTTMLRNGRTFGHYTGFADVYIYMGMGLIRGIVSARFDGRTRKEKKKSHSLLSFPFTRSNETKSSYLRASI